MFTAIILIMVTEWEDPPMVMAPFTRQGMLKCTRVENAR